MRNLFLAAAVVGTVVSIGMTPSRFRPGNIRSASRVTSTTARSGIAASTPMSSVWRRPRAVRRIAMRIHSLLIRRSSNLITRRSSAGNTRGSGLITSSRLCSDADDCDEVIRVAVVGSCDATKVLDAAEHFGGRCGQLVVSALTVRQRISRLASSVPRAPIAQPKTPATSWPSEYVSELPVQLGLTRLPARTWRSRLKLVDGGLDQKFTGGAC